MERVKTDVGLERLCNQVMREWGPGGPTRSQKRALRAEIREPTLPQRRSIKTHFDILKIASVVHALPEADARPAGKVFSLFYPAR